MPTPQMPNIPGAAVMTDTLDFVKNLWGSMGVVPGIAAPTLSVDDLDKKINDLKAVEAWLNLNSSMVRGTIQALEVQRNTIATLKSMGKSFAAAVQQPAGKENPMFESVPYASAFFHHMSEALQPPPGATPQTAHAPDRPGPTAAAEAPPAAGAGTAQDGAAPDPAAAISAQMANPAAWWNLLQDQFKQAVTTAMSPEAAGGAGKPQSPETAVRKDEELRTELESDKSGARKAPAKRNGTKPAKS